jgi:hypothetical protein
MTSPYESMARERKALAIAETIWAAVPRGEQAPEMVRRIAVAAPSFRAGFARAAKQRPPSAETWAAVVAHLERWAEAEQRRPAKVGGAR